MTGIVLPPADRQALLATLRANGARWIARFYRHEVLVARTVRGMQIDAQQSFDREIVQPLLRAIGARLSTFDLRGPDIVMQLFPELQALEAEIASTVARGSDAVRRLATERLHELTKAETDWLQESAEKVLKVPTQAPPESVVANAVETRPWLGDNVEGWFGKMLRQPTGDKVRAWVQTGLQRGLTTDEIVRGLRGSRATGYSDGILTGQPRTAVAALVRSAASHASATTRHESFKQLGVDKWRWLATLDTKVCRICAKNEDDSPYEVGSGPTFPAHPRCRCTPVPWFGEPIGTRASTDGPVPADLAVPQWLEGRSQAEQDRVIGSKAAAAAWRAGRLSFDKMLGADLQPLSVAELRRLDRIRDEE